MAFCRYCGKEIKEEQKYCAYCGGEQLVSAEGVKQEVQPVEAVAESVEVRTETAQTEKKLVDEDKGGFGWGLLGCCIPLAGLILYLLWKDTKPNSAKAAGIGALVSVIINVVVSVISVIVGIFAGMMA